MGLLDKGNVLELRIIGLHCEHCATRAERAIRGVKGVTKVKLSLRKELARVSYNGDPDDILKHVKAMVARANRKRVMRYLLQSPGNVEER